MIVNLQAVADRRNRRLVAVQSFALALLAALLVAMLIAAGGCTSAQQQQIAVQAGHVAIDIAAQQAHEQVDQWWSTTRPATKPSEQ